MKTLFLDFETKSKIDIKQRGSFIYAVDPSTEIILMAYRFSDEPKGVVNIWKPGQKIPAKLKNHKGPIVAHNWQFEYFLLQSKFVEKGFLPAHYLDITRYECTAATGLRFGLPGKLEKLAEIVNKENKKLGELGSKLINKYSKPYKGSFREITSDDKVLWETYSKMDVLATEEIYEKLPKLKDEKLEGQVFDLDKKMSIGGLNIDIKALKIVDKRYKEIIEQAEKEAENKIGVESSDKLTVNSPQGFKRWLNDRGCKVDNCQAFTLAQIQTKNKKVLRALELRQILSASSIKKIDAFNRYLHIDKKIRNFIQYYGAHTGRWAGRGVQIHNFIRKSASNFKEALQNIKNIEDIKKLLRQLIIPEKGHRFLIGDFSAIEARVLFWLSNCKNGLSAYKRGVDIYSEFAGNYIFNIHIKKVTKDQRTLGKVAILGLGYGMGKDRFLDFCKVNKIKVSPEMVEKIVNAYRTVYKEVKNFWYDCEKAFISVMQTGKSKKLGKIIFVKTKNHVKIIVPSGRALYYFRPFMDKGQLRFRKNGTQIMPLWGGIIVENITQAVARDIMAESMLVLDDLGMTVKMTVHDEIVLEVSTKEAKLCLKIFERVLATPPAWALDLPLGGECVISDRYKKI